MLMPMVDIIRRYQACGDANGGHNQKVPGLCLCQWQPHNVTLVFLVLSDGFTDPPSVTPVSHVSMIFKNATKD